MHLPCGKLKMAGKYLEEELDKWAKMESMVTQRAENNMEEVMADVVGAKTEEVAPMNGPTVNLHLLTVSHADTERETLRTEDFLEGIEKEGDSIAVVMFRITRASCSTWPPSLRKPQLSKHTSSNEDQIQILKTSKQSSVILSKWSGDPLLDRGLQPNAQPQKVCVVEVRVLWRKSEDKRQYKAATFKTKPSNRKYTQITNTAGRCSHQGAASHRVTLFTDVTTRDFWVLKFKSKDISVKYIIHLFTQTAEEQLHVKGTELNQGVF